MNNQDKSQSQKVALLSESTTFTRLPNPEGNGELLEVKVTTKVKTNAGIMHDSTQTFTMGNQDATDTLASLRVIHNNLQLILLKAHQEEVERETSNQNSSDQNMVGASSAATADLGVVRVGT